MKKIICLCIALLYTISFCIANAEEFAMWNGIQFGDSIEMVEEKSKAESGEDTFKENQDCNDRSISYHRLETEVAGVEVWPYFFFDEDGKLTDVLFKSLNDYDVKTADYKMIYSALEEKYGTPLGTEDKNNLSYVGIVFDDLIRMQNEFVSNEMFTRKYTTTKLVGGAWLIPLEDGGAVKIECMYEEYKKDQKCISGNSVAKSMGTWKKKENNFLWGYSYISPEEFVDYSHSISDDL